MFSFCLILFIILFFILTTYELPLQNYDTSLKENGFVIFNKHLKKDMVLSFLPSNYIFLDYRYTIKGCTLSTFHRDVTSSKYEFKSKFPVYTYICYFNRGNTLSLCPNSHKHVPFLLSIPRIIYSNNDKSSVLFNCDIVHAGYLNNKKNLDRLAVQYKIVHSDDLHIFNHLDNINKITNDDCTSFNYLYELLLRKLSLIFSLPINHIFTKYLQNNQNNKFNSIVSFITKKKFYNK